MGAIDADDAKWLRSQFGAYGALLATCNESASGSRKLSWVDVLGCNSFVEDASCARFKAWRRTLPSQLLSLSRRRERPVNCVSVVSQKQAKM